jgi:hypothetical protein
MNLNLTKFKGIHQLGTVPLLTGIVCLMAVLTSSCNKGSSTAGTSTLAVVLGSPDASPADLYIDGSIISTTPLVYGSYFPYYGDIASGSTRVRLDYTGTSTQLTKDTVNLASNKTYTLFLTDSIAKRDYLLVTDTIVAPPTNKASIRLVNMSRNAQGVDLVIGGQVIVSNKSYKQVSSFKTITVSDNDTLKIVQTGTNNVLGVVNAVTIQSGIVYTIWLSGFANNISSYGLQANLIRNAVF